MSENTTDPLHQQSVDVAAAIREPNAATRLERLRELLALVGPLLRPIIEALIERLLRDAEDKS